MAEKITSLAPPGPAPKSPEGPRQQTRGPNPFLGLQQAVGNQAMLRLFAAGAIQTKLRVSQPGDADEVEADRAANQVVSTQRATAIHRKCSCGGGTPCAKCGGSQEEAAIHRSPKNHPTSVIHRAADAAPVAANRNLAPVLLIVEDESKAPAPNQIGKSHFLALLRSEVCAAADSTLASVGQTTRSCPYIEKWLSFYEKQSSAHIEAALHKYAPETASVRSAQQAIRLVAMRTQRAALAWARTGKVEGLPPELASQFPGAGLEAATSGVGRDILGFFAGTNKQEESPRPSPVLRKAENGKNAPAQDAAPVKNQLGAGHSLDAQTQSRMSSAFGEDFSGVRVHTDSNAAALSSGLQARAFTIGDDVAFGAGEYRPGTMIGDTLIAHELAHVVQQNNGGSTVTIARSLDSRELESDADISAIGAMSFLFGSGVGFAARPKKKSGPRLQRCGKSAHDKEVERLGGLQIGFMEQKRKAEEDRLKKEAEEEAKKKGLPPPVTTPKVDLDDVVKQEQSKHALKGSPTTPWDTADQPKWRTRAAAAWNSVVASVKGTELESIAKGVTFNFDPEAALKGGFYASQNGHTLTVGMSWVAIAEQDPKNVWENLAHEMAGHFQYGVTYAQEIMQAALARLPSAERDKLTGDKQHFFETYEYPETEIYASLWQRRYRVPVAGAQRPSGGIHPDLNIENKLNVMKDVLQPEVAKAVLKELKRRVDANPQILPRDKTFLVTKVKQIFGYDI